MEAWKPAASHWNFANALPSPAARARCSWPPSPRSCGGTPCILRSDDSRLLDRRDWPPGECLELHAFLRLPDGSVVDAEGRRPLSEMLRAWGVRRGERFEVVEDPELVLCRKRLGCGEPAVIDHLARRLRTLGWSTAPPDYRDAGPRLTSAAIDRIETANRGWWEAWLAEARRAARDTSPSPLGLLPGKPHPATRTKTTVAPSARRRP